MADFKPTCVILFSGGVDSGVLTHSLLNRGKTVLGLSAVYGSRHNLQERSAVDKLEKFFGNDRTGLYPGRFRTARYDLEPMFMHCAGAMFKGDHRPLPVGKHHADEAQRATVVPGRNLVLIALAASLAESVGAAEVFVGAHAGDYAIYPDCRGSFVAHLDDAVRVGTANAVGVFAPYLSMDKADIVRRGLELKFPFELTRTCYTGYKTACGECASCQERLHAFAACGATDPLEYGKRDLIPASAAPAGG